MTIYIEYVILDNFTFTALICYLSYKIMREKVRMVRIVVASIVGTVCAVFYPFIKNTVIIIIFKCALCIVMCIILYFRLSKPFLHSAVFLLSTCIVGGVQFMIAFMAYGNAYDALRLPISELPLSLFFIPPVILYFTAKKIMKKINEHRLKQNYIYEFKLTVGNKSSTIRGLIDTGNSVKAHNDVVFINRLVALDLWGLEYFGLLEGEAASTTDIHTVSGNKKILLFPGKIELYLASDEHINMDVQVGIGDIKRSSEYEAILPLSILGKEKAL